MLPKDYIIPELKSFINDFPKTHVRYEHDNSSETHFIEIVPNEIYHLDAQYLQWESEMFDRFVDTFPYENICFISDDALVGLNRIDFEICGNELVSTYTTFNSQMTIPLENHIRIHSGINNESLFDLNFCSTTIHSDFNEQKSEYCQPSTFGDSISVINLPFAA